MKGALSHRYTLSPPVYPRDLRTHILRLLGPKTILYKAFGLLIPRFRGFRTLHLYPHAPTFRITRALGLLSLLVGFLVQEPPQKTEESSDYGLWMSPSAPQTTL